MLFRLLTITSFLFSGVAFAISLEREKALNEEFKTYCEETSRYVIKSKYTVTCNDDFHHYNARASTNHYRPSGHKEIRIGSYNLLHPGSNKNSYKDMALAARIMDEYDLVSVQEIIPRLGNDMRHNQDLVALIKESGDDKLSNLYRAPGYIILLEELRKLDPSWALITSPRGEASSSSSVHELLGFFYRASVVRPIETDHCSELAKNLESLEANSAFACFPLFREPFFRADVADAFSRKPFIASFESGRYDFTIMNAHVIYTSPKDEETMRWISETAFGQPDYSRVGVGVTKDTYARFAEVRLSLEMLELLRTTYDEQDLIFAADMNLESKASYWKTVFKDFDSFFLYGEMPTSLTPYRYDSRTGEETKGFSSNYDHFIINEKANTGCKRDSDNKLIVTRQSYFEAHVDEWMKKNYIAREETGDEEEPYRFSTKGKKIMEARLAEHRAWLENAKTVVKGEVVPQYDDIEHELEIYRRRIFDEQLSDFTYYKFYRELISDHYPISITCKI